MKHKTLCLVALLISGALMSPAALAQAGECGKERGVTARPLDEPTWQRLNRIYEFVGEEDYQAAYDDLIRMQNRAKGDYLRAIIAQALAQVQWALEDFDAALTSFELAVDLNALPDQTHFSLMYQIAQLYYMQERYSDALERLDIWFCHAPQEKIKSSAYVLKASINAQIKNWPEVIKAIDLAISMEAEPKETWFLLKLASNFEMQDFPAAAVTLDEIITRWPNKKLYWTQLSNVWFKLEQDEKALSVIALAYRKGLLDEQSDYLYLSNLYSFQDVPFKAADVLQSGIEAGIVKPTEKHWTIVADSWYAAEELERALNAYENAGKAAEDGEIDLRRGYILVDLERWDEARAALKMALEKGGLNERKIGEAHLMVGMSEFNLGNWDQASAAWGRASRYERSKNAAQQWMNHLREERARKAS